MGLGSVVVDLEGCKGCGLCVDACPNDVLEMSGRVTNEKGLAYAVFMSGDCSGCGNCYMVCPDACLTVYRK